MADYDRYDGMDIDELEFELEDIRNAISDERRRIGNGAESTRLKDLTAELAHVRGLIRELVNE